MHGEAAFEIILNVLCISF